MPIEMHYEAKKKMYFLELEIWNAKLRCGIPRNESCYGTLCICTSFLYGYMACYFI
jgi:hypothetical protein